MESHGDLHRFFMSNGDLVLHKWFHYFDVYERHFQRLRGNPIRMLEIGVFGGGSLKMWQSYFHRDSTIVGVDINPKCEEYANENIHVMIVSQDDEDFLHEVARIYGPFDIILDDGSHQNPHVVKSFQVLYPLLAPTGVYMIEDAHTSYMKDFGGGLKRKGTMVEFFKDKVDELNALYSEDQKMTSLTKNTQSISFYDSMIVIEKRPQGKRHSIMTHALGAPLQSLKG